MDQVLFRLKCLCLMSKYIPHVHSGQPKYPASHTSTKHTHTHKETASLQTWETMVARPVNPDETVWRFHYYHHLTYFSQSDRGSPDMGTICRCGSRILNSPEHSWNLQVWRAWLHEWLKGPRHQALNIRAIGA